MTDDEVMLLCDRIRETALAIHRHLRHGHREKIYENALVHRLAKQGIPLAQQAEVSVHDEDGTLLGRETMDLVLGGHLILEIKAVKALVDEHVAQLLGYLRATDIRHGLLINFGAPKLQIRKLVF